MALITRDLDVRSELQRHAVHHLSNVSTEFVHKASSQIQWENKLIHCMLWRATLCLLTTAEVVIVRVHCELFCDLYKILHFMLSTPGVRNKEKKGRLSLQFLVGWGVYGQLSCKKIYLSPCQYTLKYNRKYSLEKLKIYLLVYISFIYTLFISNQK